MGEKDRNIESNLHLFIMFIEITITTMLANQKKEEEEEKTLIL